MGNKRKSLHGVKSLIRALEGAIELLALAVVYYLIWRHGYENGLFPNYFGKGKYVLAGVYLVLTACF